LLVADGGARGLSGREAEGLAFAATMGSGRRTRRESRCNRAWKATAACSRCAARYRPRGEAAAVRALPILAPFAFALSAAP